MSRLRVGVLTGGGDAPGLNAAICGLGRRLGEAGAELIGFADGWRGLISDRALPLDGADFQHMLIHGGTLLGSSGDNPSREPARDVPRVLATLAKHRLDALVAIGGEGTLGAADRLFTEHGVPVVGIPKTIDNDVWGTESTFGFDTAVSTATEAIDKLVSTAQSHDRIMVVELMGRYAGWISLHSGISGSADVILIPEIPFDIQKVCQSIRDREAQGQDYGIVVVAEGARPVGGSLSIQEPERVGRAATRDPGGASGVGLQGLTEGERLVGEQRFRVVLRVGGRQRAVHRHVDRLPGVGGRDGPVAARAQAGRPHRRGAGSL